MSNIRVISVASRKGGVGKSTITILLATSLAISKKKRVLVLDCDNQQTIMDTRRLEEKGFDDLKPPYDIKAVDPRFVHSFLQAEGAKYEIIFIDIPRITDDSKDSAAIQVLGFCDSILIPVLAGRADVMSLQNFVKIIQEIGRFRMDNGLSFNLNGFLNKLNRRTENESTKQFMEEVLGISMMDNGLADLKMFLTPSTYECFRSQKTTRKRYKAFFKEFCSLYHLK